MHEASPPVLPESWISLKSADSSVSIGIPSTFHNASDPPHAESDFERPEDTASPPPPDESGGGDATPPNPNEQAVDPAVKRFVGDLNNISSQMEEQQHQQIIDEMSQKGYVIWAWLNGKQTIGEGITQISVKKIPNVGGMSLEDAVNDAKTGMPGGVEVQSVTLPIGPAKVAKSSYQNRIGDEQTEIKYVLLDNGDEYIVRFAATNNKDQIEPIADPVMQTLRIKPKP